MEITKEKVLENIKAKMGKAQKISDRTILESVESLLSFATEETTLEQFVEKIYPALDSTNRNHIADVANEIKNFKLANPTPAPTPTPAQNETPKTADEKLLELMQTLSNKIQVIESEKTIETNKTKLIAGLKQKGITEQTFIDEYLGIVNLTAETDVDSVIEKGTTFYNTLKASGTPPTPRGGGSEPIKDNEFEDIVLRRS